MVAGGQETTGETERDRQLGSGLRGHWILAWSYSSNHGELMSQLLKVDISFHSWKYTMLGVVIWRVRVS